MDAPLARFVRRYMKPWAAWYVLGLLALIATNAISVAIPVQLAHGIDALAHGAGGQGAVLQAALTVGVMGVVVIGVRTASRVLFFTPGRHVEAAVKRDLFDTTLRHQPSFLHRYETGDLFSRIGNDVNMLRLLAGFGVLQIANTVIALGFAVAQMTALDPTLTLWLALPLAIALGVVQLIIQRMFELMRRLQVEQAELSSWILSTYRGVATVQGFAAEEAFTKRFAERNDAALSTMLEQSWMRAILGPSLAFAADVDVFLVLLIGGPRVIAGDMTIGELVAFTTLVGFVTNPIRSSSFLLSIVRQAQAALERVDEVLYTPIDRPELARDDAGLPAPTAPPALAVRGLTITYPDSEHAALHDVSFDLPAGATLGVFGLTGSGKTTLLRVLSRLVDPPAGTVHLDGVDLRDLDLDDWRSRATLVAQRPFLFSESLAHNILMDDPEAAATSFSADHAARLGQVLDLCQLTPDLQAMPDGTDTRVGEAGVRLSGGQRQRTALARGFARGGVLLLLDDVMSAVDHATEKQLLGALRSGSAVGGTRPTTVLVANRVSALQHADLVLVLEEGRVAALDRPEVLRDMPGLYRDTWIRQQGEDAA